MSNLIPRAAIISAAIKGICNAQRDYEKWSGGSWLWEAPEYFAGTYVAQEIARVAKQRSWFLTMEHSTKKALDDAGAKGKGRLHGKIRPNGRSDLLLWWGNDTPRAPIEIKCQVTNFKKIQADIERIDKIIHRKESDTSLKFGMAVLYTSSKAKTGQLAKEKVGDYIAAIVRGVKGNVSSETQTLVKQSTIRVDEDSAWAAWAIVLKRS